jgi:broad specificity phosphatase PhoE
MTELFQEWFTALPGWARGWLIMLAMATVGLVVHSLAIALTRLAARLTRRFGGFLDALVTRVRAPSRLLFPLLAARTGVGLDAPGEYFTPESAVVLARVLSALVIVATTWLGVRIVYAVADVISLRLELDAADNLEARRIHTRVVLLRHGETPLSIERRFAGVGDIELTATGHEQARAAARSMVGLGIEAIASSPLRRARDTADHVARALGVDVEEWPDLAEVDFGDWEGHTFQEVGERWPEEMRRWLADLNHAPPGGESMAAAAKRVAAVGERLLAAHRGRSVLVVSHVTPIKVLLRDALLAAPEALYRMHLDVGGVSEIDYFADGPAVVRAMNDTAHLRVAPAAQASKG